MHRFSPICTTASKGVRDILKASRMAQAAKKKIVVAGGNGFLGSRICKSAVARGWDVTSLRFGEAA